MRFKFFLLLWLIPVLAKAEVGFVEPWGKDAGLSYQPIIEQLSQRVHLSPMGWLAEKLIQFHHRYITQIDGPRSHFRPSSSQYMLTAIRKYGFLRGYLMGCDRLLRENEDPWVYRTTEDQGMLFKSNPVP